MQGAGNRLRAFACRWWAGSPCTALLIRGCARWPDSRSNSRHFT